MWWFPESSNYVLLTVRNMGDSMISAYSMPGRRRMWTYWSLSCKSIQSRLKNCNRQADYDFIIGIWLLWKGIQPKQFYILDSCDFLQSSYEKRNNFCKVPMKNAIIFAKFLWETQSLCWNESIWRNMMYREGIEQLRKWKDSRRRKPLMITGIYWNWLPI